MSAPSPTEVAVGIAALPEAGPARRLALHRAGDPAAVWEAVRSGRAAELPGVGATLVGTTGGLPARWAAEATALDLAALVARHRAAAVGLAVLGTDAMPEVLATDLEPPSLLCFHGDPDVVVGPRVAVIGTRRCTGYGRDLARELGRHLATAGVSVVSGLALGIDAAAHQGALAVDGAPPIGVVGTGLDVVYPSRHGALWEAVGARGVLCSEHLLGTGPRAWHFPSRNRLLAALADVVVVVESDRRGGSMHTVREAERRQRQIMAVPGPVRSRASAGTNELLRDVASPVCDATDVLLALGLSAGSTRTATERRPEPSAEGTRLLEAMAWQPAVLDELVVRTGLAIGAVASALDELEAAGWVTRRGAWYERKAKPE